MNEFTKRVIFGLVYVLLIIFATNTNNYIFSGIFYLFMIFCTYEFNKMMKIKSPLTYIINTLFFIFGFSTLIYTTRIIDLFAPPLLLFIIFSSFIISLFFHKEKPIKKISNTILSGIYIGIPFMLIFFIQSENPYICCTSFKINLVLSLFILLWTNDTFAYLIGKKFGKNKLFERISPKKTIEGFIGGLIFTIIGGIILANLNSITINDEKLVNYSLWIIVALIVSIFGTLGDLVESMFKRQTGIKDSSNLIPGHGGFLDRLDSFIFAIPFIFIYLTTFT